MRLVGHLCTLHQGLPIHLAVRQRSCHCLRYNKSFRSPGAGTSPKPLMFPRKRPSGASPAPNWGERTVAGPGNLYYATFLSKAIEGQCSTTRGDVQCSWQDLKKHASLSTRQKMRMKLPAQVLDNKHASDVLLVIEELRATHRHGPTRQQSGNHGNHI